jgi:hypothetical protein
LQKSYKRINEYNVDGLPIDEIEYECFNLKLAEANPIKVEDTKGSYNDDNEDIDGVPI